MHEWHVYTNKQIKGREVQGIPRREKKKKKCEVWGDIFYFKELKDLSILNSLCLQKQIVHKLNLGPNQASLT